MSNSVDTPIVNISALEPLYLPHEIPTKHRVRAKKDGQPAEIKEGRRPTDIIIAQNLRSYVDSWRESDYAGASDTTRELLYHWFGRDHTIKTSSDEVIPFRYYFCQREAIETFIFLKEVRGYSSLTEIVGEFHGANSEIAALGIDPEEDIWAKYAFKLATGAGKTKVMSLAIVWSYFHALRESYSTMAKHFVVIAPNLTVFERLKEDFSNGVIFDNDPLIPVAWRGDWNLSVVLQDEASGASTGGTLYLTNIHRLYDTSKRKKKKDEDTYDWMGPAVSKAKALDTSEVLRERITSHKRIMVLNDEAHHVWDTDSAWNEAISYLHNTCKKKGGEGIVSQLDFSATPKDNKGQNFKHIVCDAPLGEAVDGGIVKSPIIGRGDGLREHTSDDASVRYQQHVMMGYARWLKSKEEWEQSGKKALIFIMTDSTEAADQIAKRLNTDPQYKELNGKTINLHTNLKGKLKKVGKGDAATHVFVEDEKEISDEDLQMLRKLSRELDSNTSPYLCIVSVLMLREGWDVRNVTTIVPLRAYSSKANILPEQTLGRGLRRMTPPGQAAEVVTVVEHSAFVNLYKEQLSQEGLPIEIVDIDKVPKTTVTIYPDTSKDFEKLDIKLPVLTAGFKRTPKLENLTIDDIKSAFSKFKPLPLGEATKKEIDYEGRHLFTNEVIEKMKIQLPLLESGMGAISYFREELERITSLRGTHQVLAPLIQTFIENILFGSTVSIFDDTVVGRLADSDVQEHIRATFVPLILEKTTTTEQRIADAEPTSVCNWKPFQVTHSENRPAIPDGKTPFNLVTCNRQFEVLMKEFLSRASDVQSFCKNAGPQCLRIDYISVAGRLSFYTPDFLVRGTDGNYVLVETKGRVDLDVPQKASAAISWCKAASTKKVKWQYLFVQQEVFRDATSQSIEALIRTCAPSLEFLLKERIEPQLQLPLGQPEPEKEAISEDFIKSTQLEQLPSRYRKCIEQAIIMFKYIERKEDFSFSPVFNVLLGPLDDASKGLMTSLLNSSLPVNPKDMYNFFEPHLGGVNPKEVQTLTKQAKNLKKTLIYGNGFSPLGLLSFCLDYSKNYEYNIGGIFGAIKTSFSDFNKTDMFEAVSAINDFRNNYVAHQQKTLTDPVLARENLIKWIIGLFRIYKAHN
ncbi:MAG: DEAD/DEAH box helicase family protein [Nitrospirae bacterium]|nr:DEAD/DEAH box helicase family protein [Nitrospirota bacterium]